MNSWLNTVIDLDLSSDPGIDLLATLSKRHGAALARASGLARRLFLLASPWAPGLCLIGGQAFSEGLQTSFSLAGSGQILEDALAGCIGEGVERLSQVERPGDVRVECSLGDADPQIMPSARALTAEILARSQTGGSTPVAWVRGNYLSTGREMLLPADWCLRRAGSGPLAIPGAALSTGCAAGPDANAAAARALLELIERDAAGLWWIGGRRPRPLPFDGAAAAAGVQLLAALRRGSRSRASWLLDITTDLSIPCVAAVSVDEEGRGLACGLAARLSDEDAVRAAVLEMCQMELAQPIAATKLKERGEHALNDVDRRHLARAAEIDADACELLHPLGAPRQASTPTAGSSGDDDLAVLRNVFATRGIEAALIELTRPEFGIPVVQAIAPALQPMPCDLTTERLRRTVAATGGGQRWTRGIPLH